MEFLVKYYLRKFQVKQSHKFRKEICRKTLKKIFEDTEGISMFEKIFLRFCKKFMKMWRFLKKYLKDLLKI